MKNNLSIELEQVNSLASLHRCKANEYKIVKNCRGCCVIETEDFFFKFRNVDINDPSLTFYEMIRQAFAQEYRKMGIVWECSIIEDLGQYYSVQRRQKLSPLTEQRVEFDDAIRSFSEIKHRVENKLEFPLLFSQLRKNSTFCKTNKIVLARRCDDGADDYAVYDDAVVSLGDSGWFLAFLNEDEAWEEQLRCAEVMVELSYGNFCFTRLEMLSQDSVAIEKIFEKTNMWWLFPSSNFDVRGARMFLVNELQKMYADNLEIAVNKQAKDVKTNSDYTNMLDECKKLQSGCGWNPAGNLPSLDSENNSSRFESN